MWDDSRFWNRVARRYARANIRDEGAYARKLEITQRYLTPGAEVLEVGCGTGTTALRHAPHAGHVLGTDISSEMIAIARERATEAGVTNVTFRQSALETLDLGEARFDAILALNLLHLLDDPAGAITRLAGALKPGGVLVSSTACLNDGLRWVAAIVPPLRLVGLAPRVRFLGGDDLRAGMRAAGLEIVEDWRPKPRAALFLVAQKPA
ncbi:class I SAM-dependent methyltransferase [Palleronia sp. KMU-117]|uniref:class I SAM-dependent methyltransferase n=1 Tax=Palleronia sp. KMU-117 TaxID=3434108 RepID=UPI003D74F5BB